MVVSHFCDFLGNSQLRDIQKICFSRDTACFSRSNRIRYNCVLGLETKYCIPMKHNTVLKNCTPILLEENCSLLSTSINRFQPFDSIAALVAEEKRYRDLAEQRLRDNIYFPGYFIIVAQKNAWWWINLSVDNHGTLQWLRNTHSNDSPSTRTLILDMFI